MNSEFEHFAGIANGSVTGKTGVELFTRFSVEPFSKYDQEVIKTSQHKQFEETRQFTNGDQAFCR